MMTPWSTSESSVMRSNTPRSRIAAFTDPRHVIPSLRGISAFALRSFATLRMKQVALRSLAALGMTLFAAAAHAEEVVVDNASPGVLVSGAWVSTAQTPGYSGPDYLFRPASAGDAT